MRVELSQAELNELIYALGFTQLHGKLTNKEIANQLDTKLYRALAIENVRLKEQLEADKLRHEMNFSRAYYRKGDY